MEVHRQTCQACGSREVRNHLVRIPSKGDQVFVQCSACQALVARYILTNQGYYHHGKDYESYLRSLARCGHFESGKSFQEKFEEIKEEAAAEFAEVLKALKEKHDS